MPRRALMYRWYARTYGWPQRVVDEEISVEMYEWYPLIEEGEARGEKLRQKQEAHESRGGRHAR